MAGSAFDILIDDSLAGITTVPQLKDLLNKRVLSLINDFEDAHWRYPKFQNYLWDNVAQTALSQRERLALVDNSHSSLVAAARNLRLTDKDEKGEGSEIAEVFLYGLMRDRFGALPVVPKIFYKQNSQDNAKGADSVHIVVSGNDFTLWFGEAKFYNSIADSRLDAVVSSVLKALSTDKLKKENAIIFATRKRLVGSKIRSSGICGRRWSALGNPTSGAVERPCKTLGWRQYCRKRPDEFWKEFHH
jgi:hypothetical protein